MRETVCCPTCWMWSDLGKAVACKRCGTPLIFAAGERVGVVAEHVAEAVKDTAGGASPNRRSRLRTVLRRSPSSPEAEPTGP